MAVNDEFYTPARTIIEELKYYGYDGFFKGKNIYLPCDYDATLPYIKKTIKQVDWELLGVTVKEDVVVYKVMPELFTDEEKNSVPRNCQFIAYLTEHKNDFGIKDIYVSGYNALTGEGLKFQNAPFDLFDVIITNPPFSQMDEWIDKIVDFGEKGGKFLFLAPLSILTNTYAFPHFKNGDFWCGYTEPSKYEDAEGNYIDKYLPSVWLTNMEVKTHKRYRTLSKSWHDHPDEYMPYWNFKAIDVPSIDNIPYDYKGVMGVPATFLKDIHMDQFEIIGLGQGKEQFQSLPGWINRKDWTFAKYLEYADTPKSAHSFDVSSLLVLSKDLKHPYKAPFCKILIRNKQLNKNIKTYDYEDVIDWAKRQLEISNPDDIWNKKLYKVRSNKKVKHGKGGSN